MQLSIIGLKIYSCTYIHLHINRNQVHFAQNRHLMSSKIRNKMRAKKLTSNSYLDQTSKQEKVKDFRKQAVNFDETKKSVGLQK